MSKLLDQLKESSPNVKLGVAVATGVAVGIAGTIAIQAYGQRKERLATQRTLSLQENNVVPLRMFRTVNAQQ